MKKSLLHKKNKTKRVAVWCAFEGEIALQMRKVNKKVITRVGNRNVITYQTKILPPNDKFVRCPECGRRLVPKHIVADRSLYLFSTIAKHKKSVKIGE